MGESKYGKPILDRVLTARHAAGRSRQVRAGVDDDSTLKSNLSVGLPLDLLVYREGSLQSDDLVCIDEQNPYFRIDPQHLGPAPARGVRGHRRPALGRWRHRAPADDGLAPLRPDAQDHAPRRAHRLTGPRPAPRRLQVRSTTPPGNARRTAQAGDVRQRARSRLPCKR